MCNFLVDRPKRIFLQHSQLGSASKFHIALCDGWISKILFFSDCYVFKQNRSIFNWFVCWYCFFMQRSKWISSSFDYWQFKEIFVENFAAATNTACTVRYYLFIFEKKNRIFFVFLYVFLCLKKQCWSYKRCLFWMETFTAWIWCHISIQLFLAWLCVRCTYVE